jgi:3-dehydroquinate synthetase
MERDKKNKAGRTTLVLTHGIGRAFLEPSIDSRRIVEFLDRAP